MKRTRLAILIPLLLMLSAVVSSTLMFWQEIRVANSSIQQAGINNLHTTLTQLQNMLNTQLAADSLEDAKLSLAVSALHPGIRTLLLADSNNTVMLANRYIWEGGAAGQVSSYSGPIAQQVRQTQVSSVSFDASLLRGYYPVTLEIVAGGLGGNRIGVLFVEYDLGTQFAQARHNAIVQAASFGGMMIAVAIAVAMLLHWLVSRRVEKIVEASKRFAAGDLDVRVHLHGHDELAELGHAFDDMAAQRREAQEALRQASIYNRSLIEASLDPLVTISAEGKVTDVNEATEKVTGRSRAELVGTDFSDYFTEPDKARAGYRQVFTQGFVTDYPLALRHRDGHVTDVLYNASVFRNEAGEVLGVFAAARDITERKRAEELLRRSEHGLAEAQRIAHLGNWELDLVSNVLTWSDEIYRIFEIDPERFGASYEAFLNAIHPEDREMVNKAYTDSLENKLPYDIVHRLQMQDGRVKYVNEKCETYFEEDGKPLRSVGTVHDITERKLDEEALQRLNRELRAISNCNQTLMRAEDEQALLDDICRIICDDAGYRMAWVGYSENDEARTIRPVAKAGVEDGYLELAKLTWADTERGRGSSGMAIRSGTSVSIEDFITDPKAAPWRDAALQRGYRSSISLPLKDENARVFGVLNIYAITPNAFTPDEIRMLEELAGDMAFGIMVLRTRIERRQAEAEIKELNRELEQRVAVRTAELEAANKELEAFSYSVSHDLRTPLRAIDGFSNILQEAYRDKLDDEGKRLINVVRDNTIRMEQLIDDILKFSRTGRMEIAPSEIDMESMAHAVFEELQPSVDSSKLQLEIEHIPPARGDSAMMRQVFVNLLSNAIKFSRNRAPARIKVGCSIEGDEAVYYVKDNGAGFDMQYADRLFGVFQRLHTVAEFEGTGIGLAIVKRIIARHGGRVWAEGKINEGATIYFALPADAMKS